MRRDYKKDKNVDKIFKNTRLKSEIRAISSKSEAHRYLICAALGDKKVSLLCTDTNADIDATAACLGALGANITRDNEHFIIEPISTANTGAMLDCNESGSTLRFLLPLAAALGADCSFIMRGRLAFRPLSPLYELLSSEGIKLGEQGTSPLSIKGKLKSGSYSLAANVSSQFISGMLFALSICEGESTLRLEGNLESAPYVEMTLDLLKEFGADIDFDIESQTYTIIGKDKLTSPADMKVGGDWSNAAFFLAAGAIGQNKLTVLGLDTNSRQGDREMLEILKKMGTRIEIADGGITVFPSRLCAVDIDAAQIPDLVPILATVASIAEGKTTIFNASRLRLKESDRIESVCNMLSNLGADITPTSDGMVIVGKPRLVGGAVDSYNDHRIAMSAAIASLVCDGEVKISRFEAISKSYPTFAESFTE